MAEPPGTPERFVRGPGPLFSVLMPTRGRPKQLLAAVDSLYSLAYAKDQIEFVFKVDDDDVDTLDVLDSVAAYLPEGTMTAEVSPRGAGYKEVHHWVNRLGQLAKGDWLFLFNDDARMLTQNWDQMVALASPYQIWHGLHEVCVLSAYTHGRPFATEFVIMRKQSFDILGHFATGPHCDNWAWTVFRAIGSAFYAPMYVEHNQHEDDATRQESRLPRQESGEAFNCVTDIRARLADMAKLMDYIEARKHENADPTSSPTPAT